MSADFGAVSTEFVSAVLYSLKMSHIEKFKGVAKQFQENWANARCIDDFLLGLSQSVRIQFQ
jgi:hypothetical protein